MTANRFSINSIANCVAILPPDYEQRLKKSRIKYKNIQVNFLSTIDLTLTKLQRANEKYMDDIAYSGIVNRVDVQELIRVGDNLAQLLSHYFNQTWQYFKNMYLLI